MLRKRVLLGELEARVLAVLWEQGPSTTQEVVDHLPAEQPRHYNTISTTLNRLARRGLVSRETQDRTHRFGAAVSREELGRTYLETLREDIFGGSAARLVSALLGGRAPDPAVVRSLCDAVDAIDGRDTSGRSDPADRRDAPEDCE